MTRHDLAVLALCCGLTVVDSQRALVTIVLALRPARNTRRNATGTPARWFGATLTSRGGQ